MAGGVLDSGRLEYANWVPEKRIIRTKLWSSELSKLTPNAFLAQRVSSINAVSAICEETWEGWQGSKSLTEAQIQGGVTVHKDPYEALDGAHAALILTEWDEFTGYDWQRIHKSMQKPAFLFDGRNILSGSAMREIGFRVYQVGKGG